MGTQVGVGISHHRHPDTAGKMAVEQALLQAAVERPDFVLMFATVGYNQQALINSVRSATHRAPLIGCSGEGVITLGEADESNFSVAVMIICSDELHWHHGVTTGLKEDATQVGTNVGQAIKAQFAPDARSLFLLADGLTFNFDKFIQGLNHQLLNEYPLPVFGGLSADNLAFKQTYQYYDDQVISDGVVWAILSGQVRLAWAINHGCVPIGNKRIITRCDGNIIYEIDHKPAVDILQEYLTPNEIDHWEKAILNLCLGFKAPEDMQNRDEYVIRFIPNKDDETKSIQIQTEVTVGTEVWMTRRDHEKIKCGIQQMAMDITTQLGNAVPKFILQFDCSGRGKMVFRDHLKIDLLNDFQKQVGPNVPWLGLYTLGEIGPIGLRNCFHDYTAVVVAVY